MSGHVRALVAAGWVAGVLLSPAPGHAEGKVVPLSALVTVQTPAGAAAPETDDPPPRVRIERINPEAEAREAEARRRAERASEPAYKRWWFWTLGAAVVAGTVTVALLASGSDGPSPARGCTPGALACFGDGRR